MNGSHAIFYPVFWMMMISYTAGSCFINSQYQCSRKCTTSERYSTRCGWWWGKRCTRYRTKTYECASYCYRKVCCSGYTGVNCIDIDECATNNGGCQQICNNKQGSFSCEECPAIANCAERRCTDESDVQCHQCQTGFVSVKNGSQCEDLFASHEIVTRNSEVGPFIVVFKQAKNWNIAKEICDARNGSLFVPDDQDEAIFIENHAKATRANLGNIVIWMGGRVISRGQLPEWENGETVRFSRWAYGSTPGNSDDPTCIGLDGTKDFRWNTFPCERMSYFMCKERTLFGRNGNQ